MDIMPHEQLCAAFLSAPGKLHITCVSEFPRGLMFRRGAVEEIERRTGDNMLKRLDFAATEARAADMTDAELAFSRKDARETAELWDRGDDPDQNSGYYRDEATVYAREQETRKKARK
jgi:hypothetical protein